MHVVKAHLTQRTQRHLHSKTLAYDDCMQLKDGYTDDKRIKLASEMTKGLFILRRYAPEHQNDQSESRI